MSLREGKEPKPSRPPFGPHEHGVELDRLELHAECREKLARLCARERQVSCPQLGELTTRAKDVEWQRRVVPRGDHESERVGSCPKQLIQCRRDIPPSNFVEIVDHDRDRVLQLCKTV